MKGLDSDTCIGIPRGRESVVATAGQPVAEADLFIAAITLSRGATLVTGNRRHYERIPGLVVEDWLRPHGGHPGR